MSLFRWSPRIAQYPSLGEDFPLINGKRIPYMGGSATQNLHCFSVGGDMHDTEERLSLLWLSSRYCITGPREAVRAATVAEGGGK